MSGDHWAGVVIPPDKGDANHVPGWTPCRCGQHPPSQDAPQTRHTPALAPNTPPRAPESPPTRSDPHRSNP